MLWLVIKGAKPPAVHATAHPWRLVRRGTKKPPSPVSFASTPSAWDSAGKDYPAILAIPSPEW
jgi:hypothetical protein